jgi:hypothetical protein
MEPPDEGDALLVRSDRIGQAEFTGLESVDDPAEVVEPVLERHRRGRVCVSGGWRA